MLCIILLYFFILLLIMFLGVIHAGAYTYKYFIYFPYYIVFYSVVYSSVDG